MCLSTSTLFTLQICWVCLCTKGSQDVQWSFTNLNEDSPWMSVLYQQDPWSVRPSLADVDGFTLRMLSIDLLHAFHLGVGRDLCGSAIRVLASQRRGLWPGSSIDARLEVATGRLRDFARQNKLSLTLKKLTKSNLTWESLKYPEIKCKGYDTYIVLKWLVEEVTMQDCGDDFLASALWAADSWLRVLSKAEMFLTEAEELHKFHVGNLFLKSYLNLAVRALEGGKMLYRLKPKFHLLYHLVNEKRPSRLNCTLNSTWMDEDAMKKWMRISRMVHKRTAAENTLRRFILGFHTKLRLANAPAR